ncbi:uncharacterized protein [Rutidosis leptorrhynchoides]|uniref:uncharacterized protein n=1 Tax=Rutidosis leptorrhynchoides TaxID=125765 RepID=UPI003A9A502A
MVLLSRKGIKEFKLTNMHEQPLKLSSKLFSCVKLERLTLWNCSLHPTPTFSGFPYLLHLSFYNVIFVNRNFGEFITQCPLLKLLEVGHFDLDPIRIIKMGEIAKLKSLECLCLQLCKLDIITFTSSLVFHLVSHFSKLQKLYLDLRKCKFIRESGGIGNWVRTSLSCLRTLQLQYIDFGSDIMLSFVNDMICGLPELQTLKITAEYNYVFPPPAFCASDLNHISMGQLQLRVIDFNSFRCSENEIWLIKSLLACSPALKKMYIHPSVCLNYEKSMFATKLLKLHRASSAAEVNIIGRLQ